MAGHDVQPRLSSDLGLPPPSGKARRGSTDELAARSVLLSVAADLQRASREAPGHAMFRRLFGVALLFAGDARGAVVELESVVLAEPSAESLNDLAAAYLALADRVDDDTEFVLKALEMAGLALARQPTVAAAVFNRAVALQRLGLQEESRAAWIRYLEGERDSAWADQGRRFLDRLGPDGRVDGPRVTARESVEQAVMVGWSNAILAGEPVAAARELALARALLNGDATVTQDRFAADLIEEAARHARRGEGRRLAGRLVKIHEARRRIVEENRTDEARVLLAESLRDHPRSGAAYELASYWLTLCDWYREDLTLVDQVLQRHEKSAASANYTYLAARSRVFRGSVLQRLARYTEAIESYRSGIEQLADLGDTEAEAGGRMLLATVLMDGGLWRDAWINERDALRSYHRVTTKSLRHNVARQAVRLSLARRQPGLAQLFLEILGANADEWGDAAALAEHVLLRSRARLVAGFPDLAEVDLAEAERRFALVDDLSFRRSYQPELLLLRTELAITSRSSGAVAAADALLEASLSQGSLFRITRGHLLLGRALAASGRSTEAEREWAKGIARLQDEARSVRNEQLRIARTSEVWDLYAELVALHVSQGRSDAALDIAEQGRARALLDAATASAPAGPTTARPAIAATVLYYLCLRDELLIWVLKDGRQRLHRISTPLTRIESITRQLEQADERVQEAIEPLLRTLHDLLIGPVLESIPPDDDIVVIPDRVVASVPFSALVSPRTGRFLVEDHALTMAPSLGMLQFASARILDRAHHGHSALVSGAPLLPAMLAQALPPLPGAAEEIELVARVYGAEGARMQRGDLTADAFLLAAPRSDVVHFAGHAVANPEYPAEGFLTVSGNGHDAMLTTARLSAARFERTRLVVLSACATASGASDRGEGSISLARPFLAGGVPQVVATLRPIHDSVGDLLVSFHEGFRGGLSAAEALRRSQLLALNRNRFPDLAGWAAFVLIGGVAAPAR